MDKDTAKKADAKKKYFIVVPISRTEMRVVEKSNPQEVDSYTRRNLVHNFMVFEGKDISRNFRR